MLIIFAKRKNISMKNCLLNFARIQMHSEFLEELLIE